MISKRLQLNHFLAKMIVILIAIAFKGAESKSFQINVDSIFKQLKPTHPRLITSNALYERLRTQTKSDSDISWAVRFLHKRADSLITVPVSRYLIKDSGLLDISRQVLDRVFLFSFLANLDGSQKYADRALAELDSAARFPDWGKAHFIDVAEMATAFAISYDWLYDFATPTQLLEMRTAIKKNAFPLFESEYDQNKWWISSKSNWNPVCNSGMILASLALGNDEPTSARIMGKALTSLQNSNSLAAFAPDGAYSEGIGYWRYVTEYLTLLFSSLQTSLGGDFGMSALPGLAETGLYAIYSEGPSRKMVNHGDAKDLPIYPFSMAGFNLLYHQPVYGWFAQTHNGIHVMDLIWFDPTATKSDPSYLPLAKKFQGPELAFFRNSWKDNNTSYINLKAGNPKSEHAHLDVGSFIFDALGKRWAIDLGSDRYSLPNYFTDYFDSTTRYTYYRVRAQGHNTLTINPGLGPDQEKKTTSNIIRFDPTQKRAVGNLTSAYANTTSNATKVWRGVSLQENGSAIIQDEFKLTAPGEVWWRMHTEASIVLSQDARSATLTLDGKKLWVTLLGNDLKQKLSALKAEPLPGTPYPALQNANTGISVLNVHLSNSSEGTIALWLVPLADGTIIPSVLPTSVSLESPYWAAGINRWPTKHNKLPFRTQNIGGKLKMSITETGPFNLVITDLKGRELRSVHGQGPSEFSLEVNKKNENAKIIKLQMNGLEISQMILF